MRCNENYCRFGEQNALKLAWVHCDLQNRIGDSAAFAAATKKYYAKYDYAVCVSENVRKSFKKMYGDTVPTVTVYNTIDDGEILKNLLRRCRWMYPSES